MKKTIFSKAIAILGAIAMLAGVAACGQSNNAGESGNGLNKVMFMLSWAPDTNHIGVYVAKNKGYFKQAGLDVDIVAVAQAGAEQAVNNGVADFALSNLTNVGMYTTKGAKIKQVMQVQQKPSAIWCSLASNKDIKSPKDFDGKTLDHLLTLPEDIKFITEDGNGVMNNAVMARAFAIATERGLTIMSHAEDREISPWDYRLAENIETVRNCHLAEYYGTRLHMCHVSTRESVDAVRMSRMRGARVSCEVTPHHLWFDDSRLTYRVNPPIRKADDVTALIDAIKDGTVTCIGTDHAPHTAEEKEKGAAGMVGLETAFGVCYTKLCREQRLPLEMLSFLMSAGPAAVLGLADRKGMLEPGYDADIVLVDLDHMYEVHADELHSKSKNCPYDGALLYGKVVTTIKGGKVTFQIEE